MGGGHRQDQVQGSGWRVDWWFAHALVVLCAGHMGSTLVLLQTPQKWQLGFWPLCILFVNCHSYFLVPYSFFVSVAGGDAGSLSLVAGEQGLLSSFGAQASHCSKRLLLRLAGSKVQAQYLRLTGLVAQKHVGSS